jgi:hypothetical protein
MKLVAVIILSALVLLLGVQIYSFLGREKEARIMFGDLEAKLNQAKSEQNKFQADLNYYLNPANLEKELRARFNYRALDEKMLILVQPNNAATSSSSTGG